MAATLSEQEGTAPHIHRQQFSLPQLPTSSVTIYPARATVVRNIKGIILKPGRNEIILHQLTPRADENSIKVSGRLTGGKILLIADMTVDLVKPPAPGGAEEGGGGKDKVVSWEPDSNNEEVEEEPTVSDNDTPTLKELSGKIQDLKSKIKDRRENVASCEKQLAYLDRWGTTLTDKEPSNGSLGDRSTVAVEKFLNTYSVQRSALMARKASCAVELEVWGKNLTNIEKEKEKLSARVLLKKLKVREEEIRKKEEERERLREEGKVDKDAKAPEKWYRVRVWIDREENDGGEDSSKVSCDAEGELELKYTVSDAGWASRYDIVISSSDDADSATDIANPMTGKVTAHLTYHAHFQNRTYETWKDALITLSTSQTVFTGLQDGAPTLEPWRIRLTSFAAAAGHYRHRYVPGGNGDGDSAAVMLKNRTYGGLYSSQEKAGIDKEKKEERKIVQPMLHYYRRDAVKSKDMMMKKGDFKVSYDEYSAPSDLTGTIAGYGAFDLGGGGGLRTEDDDGESSESDDEAASMAETLTRTLTLSSTHQLAQPPTPRPNFVTQGLTSSYSLPHRMTIPSTHGSVGDLETSTSAVRRHTILTTALSQIQLSYASTPKLRAAAYLKARILNDSSTTLRKGLVGVTLDGTFIGSTPLPRTVYPGGIFNLPLGIDESVTVTYAKPSIKRNAQKSAAVGGLFGNSMISWGKGQQEMIATYGRSTVIRNNRLDRGAIELVVCDQVPVSEDAKLVVTVTYPRGLKPPPLLAPGVKNGKAIQEEPEMDEGDEGGGEGSSMRMGHPVPTGTGVYVEGFSAIMAQEETPKPVVARPSPQQLPVPLGSTLAPSDDDSTSYQSTGKSKRKSLFSNIGRPSTFKYSYAPPPPPPQPQPQVQLQPKHQELQPFWKSTNVKEEKWGSAVAAMRRNGEVVWKVKLNPGMGVRLGLEYDAKVPAGEGIAGLYWSG
ncbi:hypothetical protein L211DRAFT_870624 [Terfezia boudieri ATCC MYA-4762]|uniref:DUF4139 domain-containing protein n=1 Tax=Terfezia boudieri ATCC MYA-4762 TaxID=1051890 RepID=A0A3N4LG28_9PEZI|nr:hypothetical protein L211DRAFT_870624 [Terfezia boudieri ATCC MYA-4762]